MKETRWYHFWNPLSGFAGGIIMGWVLTFLALIIYFCF